MLCLSKIGHIFKTLLPHQVASNSSPPHRILFVYSGAMMPFLVCSISSKNTRAIRLLKWSLSQFFRKCYSQHLYLFSPSTTFVLPVCVFFNVPGSIFSYRHTIFQKKIFYDKELVIQEANRFIPVFFFKLKPIQLTMYTQNWTYLYETYFCLKASVPIKKKKCSVCSKIRTQAHVMIFFKESRLQRHQL